MIELEVKLDAFEGPLDLLLHLIEKNKVDIYDIPIVEITEQYLDCVSKMPKDDLDLASEFGNGSYPDRYKKQNASTKRSGRKR